MSFAYTFCTLVTDHQLYEDFVTSAKSAGFDIDCEFLMIDNTGATQTDAYGGLNSMIEKSRGKIIVLCHQDILLEFDNRKNLESRLSELEQQDPNWGVCGVAGQPKNGRGQITRITDKFGDDQYTGSFPSQVVCLDECILIIKRSSGVRLSHDITGFHLYGTDICLIAEILGYKSYVINFHLRHLGMGNVGSSYEEAYSKFKQKWALALRDRYIITTALPVFLTGRNEPSIIRNLRAWLARKKRKINWN